MSSKFAPVTYSEKSSGQTDVGNCSQGMKSLLGHMFISGVSKSLTVCINVIIPVQQGFHSEKVGERCG